MKLNFLLLLVSITTLTLNSCKKDPCDSTICLNGGYCANGSCVCPEGYTGADCSQQKTPTQIRISKIDVTRFPETDNGAGWDLTSGPDIYPELSKGSTTIWTSTTYYQNANPANIYSFDLNPIVSLTSPNDRYTIRLFDYDDLDEDDFMGGINFTPYFSTNNFPSVLTIDAGGTVAFRLHVTYVW